MAAVRELRGDRIILGAHAYRRYRLGILSEVAVLDRTFPIRRPRRLLDAATGAGMVAEALRERRGG